MATQAPLLGIDPKMYRHFAAITLVIASGVAMFANDHGTSSEPTQMTSAPPPATTASASERAQGRTIQTGNGTLIDNRSAPPPPASDVDNSDMVDTVDTSAAPFRPGVAPIEIEIDPVQAARMSSAQKDDALKLLAAERKRREEAGPYRPSPMELRALRAASAIRSGSDGAD